MIVIQLDSVRKYRRNDVEWRRVNRASAVHNGETYEVVGDHAILQAICRDLVASGYSGRVEVRRGSMPVFAGENVSVWANGGPKGKMPEQFRRYQERMMGEYNE